jgi:hypothetical protein
VRLIRHPSPVRESLHDLATQPSCPPGNIPKCHLLLCTLPVHGIAIWPTCLNMPVHQGLKG